MRKFWKKAMVTGCVFTLVAGLTACGGDKKTETKTEGTKTEAGAKTELKDIVPISREEGSGTRGAFVELFGIEEKNSSGKKVDMTDPSIEVTNSTAAIIQSVMGNEAAIGYISLGSLNDQVKAVKIDGVEPTPENISNGTYKIARPFNLVTTGKENDTVKDFINFIMSREGQTIVEENKYIAIPDAKEKEYKSTNPQGKISIDGSSSVTPVMQKLAEAYQKLNANVKVDVQQTDSTSGVKSVLDGVCDLGMASRELKDSEKEKGAKPLVIAQDGIAVIVNKANPIDNMTKESVKEIYTKQATEWEAVK